MIWVYMGLTFWGFTIGFVVAFHIVDRHHSRIVNLWKDGYYKIFHDHMHLLDMLHERDAGTTTTTTDNRQEMADHIAKMMVDEARKARDEDEDPADWWKKGGDR